MKKKGVTVLKKSNFVIVCLTFLFPANIFWTENRSTIHWNILQNNRFYYWSYYYFPHHYFQYYSKLLLNFLLFKCFHIFYIAFYFNKCLPENFQNYVSNLHTYICTYIFNLLMKTSLPLNAAFVPFIRSFAPLHVEVCFSCYNCT